MGLMGFAHPVNVNVRLVSFPLSAFEIIWLQNYDGLHNSNELVQPRRNHLALRFPSHRRAYGASGTFGFAARLCFRSPELW